MAHNWQLALGILSALLCFPLAATTDRPSLSVVTMVPLLELEKKLIDNLDDYAKALDYKLQLLRSHLLNMRAENEKAQQDPIHYISNPLNGFSLIRRLHSDWVGWRKFMEHSVGIVQMRKMNAWRRELPTKEDLSEACEGIARIQDVYNLRVNDIINGKLRGRQYNAKMSPSDVFAVGNHLSQTSSFSAAALWLGEVRPLSQEELASYQDPFFRPEKEVLEVVTAMHLFEGHFSIALSLMNYWLQLFPHDARYERARQNLKKLMKYKPEIPLEIPGDPAENICSGNLKGRRPNRLRCSYKSSPTAFLRLAPIKMEQIGMEPYVVLYHDVLSPREISQLQKLKPERFRNANVLRKNTRKVRSAKLITVGLNFNRLTKRIKRRIEDISGLKLAGSEGLGLVNYGIGGHFNMHTDYFENRSDSRTWKSGNRIATVLFYLSDVEQGGETVFPKLEISVPPRAGTALFWYNLHTDGIGDNSTIHAACPVIVGSKWIMTQWIEEHMQLFKRPCLSPSQAITETKLKLI